MVDRVDREMGLWVWGESWEVGREWDVVVKECTWGSHGSRWGVETGMMNLESELVGEGQHGSQA